MKIVLGYFPRVAPTQAHKLISFSETSLSLQAISLPSAYLIYLHLHSSTGAENKLNENKQEKI